MQNIYQVQMTTEKCRWRRKRTDLSRNSEVFIQNGGFQGRASQKKICKRDKIPVYQ
ncbi:hypothetical protein K443DRAFT_113136 [Laccaria amethystina LaAM-08-1]|uniref:Uncharacterized protein n=1 Tax=Laccaria amethystina LaAM-08-1 TaxID=1095629 RepID=A0A0C9WPB7_9AGAR|nr:hypothetical protein K443DRAFT_113136 [Laccaria amethystina LaAM-08-1]